LTRELGQLQQQYHQLQKKQAPTIYIPPTSLGTDKSRATELSSYTDIPPTQYSKVLFITKGDKWEGVKVKDIAYLQGQKRFTRIVYKDGVIYEVPQTMQQLLEQLPNKSFVQIHRSYIIHLKYLTNVTPKEDILLMNGSIELPISRGRFDTLVKKIKVLKRK